MLGSGANAPKATSQTLLQGGRADCRSRLRADEVGINVSNLSFAALADPHVLSALKQSGARWIRINLYWGWLEQNQGTIEWRAVDQGLSALAAIHMSALVTLNGPVPCWALDAVHARYCTEPQQVMPQSAVLPWVRFVAAAVQRYHNQVHYWEIWNEPDLFPSIREENPTKRLVEYRNFILKPAARAIRRADPSAEIVAPAFAAIPSGNSAPGPQLQAAMRLILGDGVASYIDVVSLHSYYPYSVAAKLGCTHKTLREMHLSDRPIWITELGFSGKLFRFQNAGQREAGFLVDETTNALKSHAADRVFWFALTDSPTAAGAHADDYGLISNDDYSHYVWHPRPAYTALQYWIRTGLRDPE